MKRLLTMLLALMLVLGTASPALARIDTTDPSGIVSYTPPSEESLANPPKLWQITMRAQVVSNQGSALAVYLNNPQNMAVREGDTAHNLQTLPLTEKTAYLDASGKALAPDALLPGQQVDVTFTYRWQESKPRYAQIEVCKQVKLAGEALKVKSTAKLDDFGREKAVAVVLPSSGSRLSFYVESGLMFYGKTEYLWRGSASCAVGSSTKITDAQGKSIQLSQLAPYTRVVIEPDKALWMESFPPMYGLGSIKSITVLGQGEKILPPGELRGAEYVRATVSQAGLKDEYGSSYLKVKPAQGSRLAGLAGEFTLYQSGGRIYGKDGKELQLGQLKAGMELEIRFEGLQYDGETGKIAWYHRIDVL